jgi:hypothetical protein
LLVGIGRGLLGESLRSELVVHCQRLVVSRIFSKGITKGSSLPEGTGEGWPEEEVSTELCERFDFDQNF